MLYLSSFTVQLSVLPVMGKITEDQWTIQKVGKNVNDGT